MALLIAIPVRAESPKLIEVQEEVKIAEVVKTEEEITREYFKDIPIMIDVIRCESTFRQFDENGSVLRGKVNPKDIGLSQINEHYHLETSKKLGLDIYTIEGNLAYARYLYSIRGTTDWVHSKPCWGGVREVII